MTAGSRSASSKRLPPRVQEVPARRIITRNESPDIGFDRSINPYRGCEHGCIYCFARPTHAFLGLSPGLDFETKLFAKTNAAEALARELAEPGYDVAHDRHRHQHRPLPADRAALPHHAPHPRSAERGEPSGRHRHQVGAGAARSRHPRARWPSAAWRVALSVTTLDRKLARAMEPRASTPDKRLETLERLVEAGVPTAVMVAPVIPGLTDMEMERILERGLCGRACSRRAMCCCGCRLRSSDLFTEWLQANCPDRANRVLSLMRSTRGGKDYDAKWGERMTGDGPYAWMIGRRFELAAERLGFNERCGLAAHRPVHAARAPRPAAAAVLAFPQCGEPSRLTGCAAARALRESPGPWDFPQNRFPLRPSPSFEFEAAMMDQYRRTRGRHRRGGPRAVGGTRRGRSGDPQP